MTYLAVPIAAKDISRAVEQIVSAKATGAEVLELRTDYLQNLSVGLVTSLIAKAKATGLPIIVTCRDKQQSGANDYPQALRTEILTQAVKIGADFVDCEYDNFQKIKPALSKSPKVRLILSAHNFEGKFENINKLYQNILDSCPSAIPKLIYTANHINDCFEAFDLLKNRQGDAITFAMGKAGLITRIIAKKLGSLVTFASLDEAAATAPGQLTVDLLRKLYRYDSINSDTELFGVIAAPVAHSLSPHIHNACFAEAVLNKLYLPLLVEGGKTEFDRFMHNVLKRDWLHFKGFSVTIPHKANGLDYVKAKQGFIQPLAEKIGTVNTLLIGANGKLSAYNTDYAAALEAITSTLGIHYSDLKDLSVAVIGAGGVARAIVGGLTDAAAKIKIYNRTLEKARRLADEFNCDYAPFDDLQSLEAKLVINGTSIGMYPDTRLIPYQDKFLKENMIAFDTVYNPVQTPFIKRAIDIGAKTIDGLSMFIKQAAGQFKLFTGIDADTEIMRKTVLEKIAKI